MAKLGMLIFVIIISIVLVMVGSYLDWFSMPGNETINSNVNTDTTLIAELNCYVGPNNYFIRANYKAMTSLRTFNNFKIFGKFSTLSVYESAEAYTIRLKGKSNIKPILILVNPSCELTAEVNTEMTKEEGNLFRSEIVVNRLGS